MSARFVDGPEVIGTPLELADKATKLHGHAVEGVGQGADLVFPQHFGRHIQIPGGDALRRDAQVGKRADDRPRQDDPRQDGQSDGQSGPPRLW